MTYELFLEKAKQMLSYYHPGREYGLDEIPEFDGIDKNSTINWHGALVTLEFNLLKASDSIRDNAIFRLRRNGYETNSISEDWNGFVIEYRIYLPWLSSDSDSVVTINTVGTGLSKDDNLFDLAVMNVQRLLPAVITQMFPQVMNEMPILVITNNFRIDGATQIVIPGILDTVADRLGSNVIVITPSSIQECICFSLCAIELNGLFELQLLLTDTNIVSEDEILSEQFYFYLKDTKEIITQQEFLSRSGL